MSENHAQDCVEDDVGAIEERLGKREIMSYCLALRRNLKQITDHHCAQSGDTFMV